MKYIASVFALFGLVLALPPRPAGSSTKWLSTRQSTKTYPNHTIDMPVSS